LTHFFDPKIGVNSKSQFLAFIQKIFSNFPSNLVQKRSEQKMEKEREYFPLTYLPDIVMSKVFGYLSFDQIAKMRLISQG
jgi:hypothetical protein